MKIPTYDLFAGLPDKDASWLEAIQGLGAACDRMKDLAAESPDPYFVFCTQTRKVLASIDTRVDNHIRRYEDHSESA
jgi:hypothetical protein